MIAGKLLSSAVAACVLVGLVACASPVVMPAPSVTATTPVDTSPAVVTVSASTVSVTTKTGVVLEAFDYFTDADAVVALLTDAFGSAPTVEHIPGLEEPGYTSYGWSGFQLQALDAGADAYPPLRVTVVVTSVGDVLISTVDGISVGANADAVAAAHPDTTQEFALTNGPNHYAIRLDETTLTGPTGETYGVYVGLGAEVGGPVTSIAAPQLSLGV
ncbi:MAG: hypothetical protein KF761_04530 [Salinibacterium sp.]|nr:hypothetical protein [Salinibacterium sp.]